MQSMASGWQTPTLTRLVTGAQSEGPGGCKTTDGQTPSGKPLVGS